jgi:hypothetical protein
MQHTSSFLSKNLGIHLNTLELNWARPGPERDIDMKFLEFKVMLIIFLSLD